MFNVITCAYYSVEECSCKLDFTHFVQQWSFGINHHLQTSLIWHWYKLFKFNLILNDIIVSKCLKSLYFQLIWLEVTKYSNCNCALFNLSYQTPRQYEVAKKIFAMKSLYSLYLSYSLYLCIHITKTNIMFMFWNSKVYIIMSEWLKALWSAHVLITLY